MGLDFSSLLPETRLHKLLTGPGSSLAGGFQDGPVGLGALSSAPAFLLVPLTPLAQRSILGSDLQPRPDDGRLTPCLQGQQLGSHHHHQGKNSTTRLTTTKTNPRPGEARSPLALQAARPQRAIPSAFGLG